MMGTNEAAQASRRKQALFSSFQHPPYILEKNLIQAIQQTNLQRAMDVLHQINQLDRASLSDSPLRSTKNSIICSCTLFTRAVIEKGTDSERSFALSDRCIQEIEAFETVQQTSAFEYEMLGRFIELLRTTQEKLLYSQPVNRIICYIQENIQRRITVGEIAAAIGYNANYISTLYKKEVGASISSYIRQQKAEAIRSFLADTDLSLTDIACLFDFSSVSYFSNYCKSVFGISPLHFRKGQMGP